MQPGYLTSRSHWTGSVHRRIVLYNALLEVFHAHLQPSPGKTCLEIGCAPGGYLAYLGKHFGYRVEGIDYVPNAGAITGDTLHSFGVKPGMIHEADFLEWTPDKQYDLVCSFGFIEHFAGSLNELVIARHVELVKPGGLILLEVPNFRSGQYLIHRALDPDKLLEHNLATMRLSYFRKIARHYDLAIRHLGYAGGFFDFWTSSRQAGPARNLLIRALNRLKHLSAASPMLRSLDNRFLSPIIVFVAVKGNPH